jgi:hypothetical protein
MFKLCFEIAAGCCGGSVGGRGTGGLVGLVWGESDTRPLQILRPAPFRAPRRFAPAPRVPAPVPPPTPPSLRAAPIPSVKHAQPLPPVPPPIPAPPPFSYLTRTPNHLNLFLLFRRVFVCLFFVFPLIFLGHFSHRGGVLSHPCRSSLSLCRGARVSFLFAVLCTGPTALKILFFCLQRFFVISGGGGGHRTHGTPNLGKFLFSLEGV